MDRAGTPRGAVEPIQLVALASVGARLGVARAVGHKIALSGLAGSVYSDGNRDYVLLDEVNGLATQDISSLDGLPPALVVKVAPAEPLPDDPDRDVMGWSATLSAAQKDDGIRMWWPVAGADGLVGQLLVAVIGGYVVEVRRITSAAYRNGRVKFGVERPSDDDAAARSWIGRRIAPRAGGIVDRHAL